MWVQQRGRVIRPSRTRALLPLLSPDGPASVAPLAPADPCPRPQDSQYPWSQRVSFAKDIASGMVSRRGLSLPGCGLGEPTPLRKTFSPVNLKFHKEFRSGSHKEALRVCRED